MSSLKFNIFHLFNQELLQFYSHLILLFNENVDAILYFIKITF